MSTGTAPRSLNNSGNNCWLNALIQVLVHAPELRHWCEQTAPGNLVEQLTVEYARSGEPANLAARYREFIFPGSGWQQQDAAEALNLMVSHGTLHRVKPPITLSTITEYVVHSVATDTRRVDPDLSVMDAQNCLTRGEDSWCMSVLQDLHALSQAPESQIADVLFGWRAEQSDVHNLFRCKQQGSATVVQCLPRRSRLSVSAPFLFITLQRMKWSPRPHKFQGAIAMPITLVCPGSSVEYELCGMVEHMGDVGGGHYVSFVRNAVTKNWWRCDDSHIESLTSRELPLEIRQRGYVYYYEPCNPSRQPVSATSSSSTVARIAASPLLSSSERHVQLILTDSTLSAHNTVTSAFSVRTKHTHVTTKAPQPIRIRPTAAISPVLLHAPPPPQQPSLHISDPLALLTQGGELLACETQRRADDMMRWLMTWGT